MPLRDPARALHGAFLTAVVAFGAWLRLTHLGGPSLWLDEILNYDIASRAVHLHFWRWAIGFDNENGPLYYLTELAGRIYPSIEWSARVAPALFGIATIVVAWFAARAAGARAGTAYAFPLLIAAAPLHVYYSREGRTYALLMLLTTALIAALLRRSGQGVIIALLIAALYTAATSLPLLLTVAVASVRSIRRTWKTGAAALFVAAGIPLLYRGGANAGAPFPPITVRFFENILQSFTAAALDTSHLHRVAYIFLALAIIGSIDCLRRDREQAVIVLAFAILPAAIAMLMLHQLNHFFAVRYLACSLPGFLLLVCMGIGVVAASTRQFAPMAAIVIAVILARDGLSAAMDEPYRKLDWRSVARTIARHAHASDAVIASNDWTAICLQFYFRGLAPRIHLLNAGGGRMGEVFAYSFPMSWIVIGGYDPGEFAAWSCRFPVILGSPLENLRVHYCPGPPYFLRDRSIPAEQRALLDSFGSDSPVLHAGPGEDVFFAEGWGSAEPEEGRYGRWAIGTRALVALPLRSPDDRTIMLEVTPVSYPGAPQQRLTVQLNDQTLQTIKLANRRSRYTIAAPRDRWRSGVNQFIFDFDHATAPADVDPRSSDHRQLAARFYEIGVIANGSAAPPPLSPDAAHLVRLDEGSGYLDEASLWREEGGLPLPRDFDRAKLAQFVGRLGFDPPRAIAELESGRVTLAGLATSIADNSVCLDDQAFLRMMFPALLGRGITDRELRHFRFELGHGIPRATIVRRLANSDEVRILAFGVPRLAAALEGGAKAPHSEGH